MPRLDATAPPRAPDSPLVLEEIAAGQGVTMAEAARAIPSNRPRGTSPSTVYRWCVEGLPASGGGRLHLESARCGCRLFTSRAALMRFLAAQNGLPAPQAAEASRVRERQISEAERQLRAAGV